MEDDDGSGDFGSGNEGGSAGASWREPVLRHTSKPMQRQGQLGWYGKGATAEGVVAMMPMKGGRHSKGGGNSKSSSSAPITH